MHFRKFKSVATALIVFAAASLQYCPIPAADAHAVGAVGSHQIKKPGKVQATAFDNVRDFGATGNGTTDDTNAIQNAANDAAARHIGVFFPAGTYLHASTITFNGVPVSGVGTGSVLVAVDPNNCAIILSGYGVSFQNMVVSTQGLTGGPLAANNANLTVYNATSWTVSNDTIVTGSGFCGLLTLLSTVGAINSVVIDGTGNTNDYGIFLAQAPTNITVSNCLLQNETTGIEVGGLALWIAVVNNTIGNATYPTKLTGIAILEVENCDVAGNTVQMADNRNFSTAILMNQDDNFTVANNNTYGAAVGISVQQFGAGTNFVAQNAIHNCGVQGIETAGFSTSRVQVISNVFGECGLTATGGSTNNAVILITGSGADQSGAMTYVGNNSYQGHANGLASYVTCTFISPRIPATNVVGNTQTQTTLSNHI